MPELEAACRKAANRVGEHEADRKQRQRYQRRGTQLTFFLRRKLRCDRKRRQRCTAMALRRRVLFDSYRRVVLDSPDTETADGYMNSLMTYYLGGWGALFDSANKSEEDVKNEV